MPKFVIERILPGVADWSEAQIHDASLKSIEALAELGAGIQWIHSFVTDNKVYCIYLAPDEETIREHAFRAGIPVNRIAAVRHLLDPANY
jgi:hypothetical protein